MADDDTENTVRLQGRCAEGHMHAERREGDRVENCILVPGGEGKPIPAGGEYVELAARDGEPGVYDVTLSHKGPARVSTPAYREGYERIFGESGRGGPTDPNQLN